MTRRLDRAAPLGAALVVALAAACADTAPTSSPAAGPAALPEAPSGAHAPLGRNIYGLDDRNTLVTFSGDAPGTVSRTVAITGVAGALIGLDVRPNDTTAAQGNLAGSVYAVSATGAVYTVDPATGAATLRSTLSVAPAGAHFGVGFNPQVDRLRFHSETGQNLRANVESGATIVDTLLAYEPGDVNFGKRPAVVATGYTNSVNPAPRATELYAIDAEQDVLVELKTPNSGKLTTVGRLVVDNGMQVGFDIPGRATDRTGYATFTPPRGTRSFLYRVNLDDARREPIAPIGHARPIISIAIDDAGIAGPAGMSFFVTSAGPGNGANLGGLAGADRACQQLATTVGAGGRTWRAYLSTSAAGAQPAVNARDRIGQGPWYNVNGALIAQNVAELHGEAAGLTKQTALTERGEIVLGSGDSPNSHDILTGSQGDGTAFAGADDRTCGNWTSDAATGAAQVGHHDRRGTGGNPPNSWNSAHPSRGCGQQNLRTTGGAGLFYCFAP